MKGAEGCCGNFLISRIAWNISHHFNVVFVFCVVILLATAVKASPMESRADIEIILEPETMFNDVEKSPENKIESADVRSNEAAEMINEPSEDTVADTDLVKNLEADGEVFQVDEVVDVEPTAEDLERIIGVGIPLCMQYSNDRNPLHLR